MKSSKIEWKIKVTYQLNPILWIIIDEAIIPKMLPKLVHAGQKPSANPFYFVS